MTMNQALQAVDYTVQQAAQRIAHLDVSWLTKTIMATKLGIYASQAKSDIREYAVYEASK